MKLVYDMASLPKGLDPGNLTKMYEQHNIIFWDSNNNGTKPRLFSADGSEAELTIVDTKGKEIDIEIYKADFLDKEHWDKELYKCKKSPIYYFNNFKTTKWPATNEDIKVFLDKIGMGEVVAEDSKDAEENWEKAKKVAADAMKSLTLEELKDDYERVQIIKNEYFVRVEGLEQKLKSNVKLFDSSNERLPDKKLKANLVGKIRVCPIPPELIQYRTKKNRWDSPMLFVTNYDVLLQIYDDVLTYKTRFDNKVQS